MSANQNTRFSGVARLYSQESLDAFLDARVVIVGIGGVGSWVAEALARSGIGTIRLVDLDEICLTNINRQLHAMDGQIGRQKTAAMADRITAINPDCNIEIIEKFFSERTVPQVLDGPPSVLVDAIDSLSHKALLIAECHQRKIPTVTCGGAGGKRDPTRIKITDLAYSGKDALLHQLRRTLRRKHHFPAVPIGQKPQPMEIRAVFSDEPPQYPQPDGSVSCNRPESTDLRLSCETGYGTAAHLTGAFGLAAASEVLRLLSPATSAFN